MSQDCYLCQGGSVFTRTDVESCEHAPLPKLGVNNAAYSAIT